MLEEILFHFVMCLTTCLIVHYFFHIGKLHNKNKSFSKNLKEKEIDELIEYLNSLKKENRNV